MEKMNSSNRKAYLGNQRHWCLSVKAKYRDATATDRDYDGSVSNTKATIIITIKDIRHKGLAYHECYASLENHNFIHSSLEIQQHIKLDNNG